MKERDREALVVVLDRFFREDEQLIASQVHRRVLELDRRKQEELERARRKAAERVDELLGWRLRVELAKRAERERPPDGDHDGLQADSDGRSPDNLAGELRGGLPE